MKYFIGVVLAIAIFQVPVFVYGANQNVELGLLPDSPWYFLKSWKESIGLFFTFGKENKVQERLRLAELRLEERKVMSVRGKENAAEKVQEAAALQIQRVVTDLDSLQAKGERIGNGIVERTDGIIAQVSNLSAGVRYSATSTASLDYFIQPLFLASSSRSIGRKPYAKRFSVFGSPTTPILWTLEEGKLPLGLEFVTEEHPVVCTRSIPPHCASTADAFIKGTPQESGKFVFTVQAKFEISGKEFVLRRVYTMIVAE